MKKNIKKLTPIDKKLLQFLVQDFLEADLIDVEATTKDYNKIEEYWNNLVALFFKNEFWMDEIDPEDMEDIDKKQFVLECYVLLKPLWSQFKDALIDYKNRIVPMKEKSETLRYNIENDTSTQYYNYKDLLKTSDNKTHEKFYDITFGFKVSFDTGHATFYKRKINIINNFLDLFFELPISLFSQCNYCEKVIVMTRSDKRYCIGCAAKKYQKDKWKNDPEGMKQKEKMRYQTKRKQSD